MKYIIGIAAIGGALFLAIPGGVIFWMGLRGLWHGLACSRRPTVSGVVLHGRIAILAPGLRNLGSTLLKSEPACVGPQRNYKIVGVKRERGVILLGRFWQIHSQQKGGYTPCQDIYGGQQ
ncbi:MAG TPA: hypothetical protein VMV04_20125 [Thermodesulfobacteriota bacterium]|nr:hypothetical protein [Thermodesulfobacteriota bacterium]